MSKKQAEPNGLQNLLRPFEPNQISKLPKPTKDQTEAVRNDYKKGIRCELCGGWHHPQVVHLDYVGHAALTYRLLETDINWNWEPLALDARGLPLLDENGGLWIKLTVLGQTRLGYGTAEANKQDRMKELIGDALRNAAMRFGAALDLWHKGDSLHKENADEEKEEPIKEKPKKEKPVSPDAEFYFPAGEHKGKHFLELAPEKFNAYFEKLNGLIEKNSATLNLIEKMKAWKEQKGI